MHDIGKGGGIALYIDSADLGQITALWSSRVFTGVTTNPKILARAGLTSADHTTLHADLRALGVERIFMQVDARSESLMRTSAAGLRELDSVVVKIPATRAGITLARELVLDGVQVLLTALYHPVQALIACELGVQWIAPYVGRISDAGDSGVAVVTAMQGIVASTDTQILAASLRSVDCITELAVAGIADFTVATPLAAAMLDSELTRSATEEFNRAE